LFRKPSVFPFEREKRHVRQMSTCQYVSRRIVKAAFAGQAMNVRALWI